MTQRLQHDIVETHGPIGSNMIDHQKINLNCRETFTHTFSSINTFDETYNKHSKHLLAKGGQSNIYTYLTHTKKLVIAKEYDTSKQENALQLVWTEFNLIQQSQLLSYNSIYYDERKQKAIIMSEVLNYTLRDYVGKKNEHRNISEDECKIIMLDIMDKLWTMHKTGFIHNDLTPDNIMYKHGDFDTDNNSTGWKIIDFGLILSQQDCDRNTYKYHGTRGWTSPEIVVDSQNNKYSYAKDIWSLGLIILYILCKSQPYLMTGYEQHVLCKGDKCKYGQYFYYNKLLQLAYSKSRMNNEESKFKKFMKKQFRKGNSNDIGKKKVEMMDFEAGELYLKKYLMNLYENKKISYDLCNLLSNYVLTFDPKRRLNVAQMYKHKWFNTVRHL